MDRFDLQNWPGFLKAGGHEGPAYIDQVVIHSNLIWSKNALFVALPGSQTQGTHFLEDSFLKGARYALVPKNFKPPKNCSLPYLLHVENPLHAMQEIAASYRKNLSCTLVAIMGSSGKTLLKDLLLSVASEHALSEGSIESYNSQIGVALSLFHLSSKDQFAFIELAVSKPKELERLYKMTDPDHLIFMGVDLEHPYFFEDNGILVEDFKLILSKALEKGWVLTPEAFKTDHSNAYTWDDNRQEIVPSSFSLEDYHPFFQKLISITCYVSKLLAIPNDALLRGLKKHSYELRKSEIWKTASELTFINEPYVSSPDTLFLSLCRFKKLHTKGRRWIIFGGYRSKQQESVELSHRLLKEACPYGICLDTRYVSHDLIKKCEEDPFASETYFYHSEEELFSLLKKQLSFEDSIFIRGAHKIPSKLFEEYAPQFLQPNQLRIDLTAIRQNIQLMQQKMGPKKALMPVLKSQAYGTDSVILAHYLESCGVHLFGVAYVNEALHLRRHGVYSSIFVLHASISELELCLDWDFEVGVSDRATLSRLQQLAKERDKTINVHLHVNTGMTRLGCDPTEALDLARRIHLSSNLNFQGLMTHFAQAEDEKGDAFTLEQSKILKQLSQALSKRGINPHYIHAENSAALNRFGFPGFNLARIGLALFGIASVSNDLPLKPALSMLSSISRIHECHPGDTVSYGRSYTVSKEERIAVIPIGYFDGIHRHYAKEGQVLIHNKKAPVVGSICMDFMMVNITHIPEAKEGDSVLLFGEDDRGNTLAPELFAKGGDTISHELITCIGPRVQRLFMFDEHAHPLSQPDVYRSTAWIHSQSTKNSLPIQKN